MAVVATAERGLIVYQLENQPSEFRRIESPLKHQVSRSPQDAGWQLWGAQWRHTWCSWAHFEKAGLSEQEVSGAKHSVQCVDAALCA